MLKLVSASSLYLVLGDDEYRVSAQVKTLLETLSPGDDALGRDVIDGGVATVDEALAAMGRCEEALQTSGLFAAEKVVWFRDLSFLATQGNPGRSDRVKERVIRFTTFLKQGLPDGQSLVVSAGNVDKRSAFYKVFKSGGEVFEFKRPEKAYLAEKEAADFARGCLQQAGVQLAGEALDCFVERVGTDSRHIASEAEKLALYLGEEARGSRQDVLQITSPGREALGWDLADAFGERDLVRALSVLRQLLFQREAPVRLMMAIESRIDDLLLYREAIDQRWLRRVQGRGRGVQAEWTGTPSEVDDVLGGLLKRDPRKTHPFRVGLLARQANRFSRDELETARQAAVDAHRTLVSGSAPGDVVLELLLVSVLGS